SPRLFPPFTLPPPPVPTAPPGAPQPNKPDAALAQSPSDDKVSPGEAKPIPKTDPGDPADPAAAALADTKTDPDTLPVLPKLSAPTGQEKYEAAVARAFLLMAEKKAQEAVAALQEARAAQEPDFVKTEIERLQARITRQEAAQKAADDIKEILDAGKAAEAAKLAADALAQYGDSDAAEA